MRSVFSVLASAAMASASVQTITEEGYVEITRQLGKQGMLIGFTSKEAMSELDEYFKGIRLDISVGAADEESIPALSDLMDMDGGATFALLYGGRKVPYTLDDVSPESIATWIRVHTTMKESDLGYVKLVDDDDFSSQVFLPSRVAIVLFDTETASPLSNVLKIAADLYEKDILSGEITFVRATQALAPSRYDFGMEHNDNEAPQLAFYGRRKGKYSPVFYTGEETPEGIAEWINDRTGAGLVAKLKENMLVPLTDTTFDPVLQSVSMGIVVLLHAPWCGHCKRVMPTFNKLADELRQLRAKVLITTVDATAEKTIGRKFKVEGYPTIMYVDKYGGHVEYSGDRSLESLTEFTYKQIGEQVPGEEPTAVTIIRDANFDDILKKNTAGMFIKFYAPWCGHCKRMAPAYEQLGDHFSKNDVLIAKLDATKHNGAADRFQGISGFPTLLWLAPGAEPSTAEKYKAGRDFEAMKKWVEYKTSSAGASKTETPQKAPATASLGTAGSVLHLTTDTFNELTSGRSKDVLVMFHATWCGHCKKLSPDYEKLAKHFSDKFDKYVIVEFPTL